LQRRNEYNLVIKKLVGGRLFEDVEEKEGDITKTSLKETGCKDVNLIPLDQDIVKVIVILPVP
jgi:hypothetical protein